MADLDKFMAFLRDNNIDFELSEYFDGEPAVEYQLVTEKAIFKFDRHDNFKSIE